MLELDMKLSQLESFLVQNADSKTRHQIAAFQTKKVDRSKEGNGVPGLALLH